MAGSYGGLLGAYVFALRRSRSWLFRSYVVASAALGLYLGVLLVLALVSWLASPLAFGETAFLGVLGLLVLGPLFAPVLVTARRHRLADSPPRADRWLALGGYAFVAAVVLALFVADPTPHAVGGALGPVVAWLDGLPAGYGLVPPVVAAALLVAIVRLTGPSSA